MAERAVVDFQIYMVDEQGWQHQKNEYNSTDSWSYDLRRHVYGTFKLWQPGKNIRGGSVRGDVRIPC